MTYRSRGRSNIEVFLAVAFAGFLIGFVLVLCIGNYFRAKRAQERQRERRLERLAAHASNNNKAAAAGDDASAFDTASMISHRSEQHQRLISKTQRFQQQQQQNASSTSQRRRATGANDFMTGGDSNRNIHGPMDSKQEFLLSV